MVEEVDDRFTKSRFGSDDNGGDGALYKDVFPKSTDASFYSDHLKEGKNEGLQTPLQYLQIIL